MITFSVEEAVELLDEIIIDSKNKEDIPDLNDIGTVAGLMTFNEEVELVIKFIGRLDQCTKKEFNERYKLIKT